MLNIVAGYSRRARSLAAYGVNRSSCDQYFVQHFPFMHTDQYTKQIKKRL